MGLRIGTNTAALATNRFLTSAMQDQTRSYERLASGQRIIHAADDAAGLSIAEGLRTQIRSMTQAERNASDAVAFTQVAEGGLSEISNIMIRLRELGIQGGSDTMGDHERGYINTEAKALTEEITRIASVTSFNNVPLLNGQASKDKLTFQVGTKNSESDHMEMDIHSFDVRASALDLEGLDYSSMNGSLEALDKVDAAMEKIFANRSSLAAIQSNLQSTLRNLGVTKENLSSAHSQVADTDIAAETSELAKSNILQSAGIAILAQANSSPTQALKLI